jgi:hypothetical protein
VKPLLLAAALMLVSCTTSRPPGAAQQGVTEAPRSLPAPEVVRLARAQSAAKAFASKRLVTPPAIAAAPAAAPAEPTVEVTRIEERAPAAPPARDYESELRTLAGDPISCVPRETARERVRLRVSVVVTESGVVSRVSAASSESQPAADCVARRLAAARFRAPVEGAPRTVETTFDLRFREAP